MLWPFRLLYGHLVYFVKFMVIWYIFPILVCFTKKNLATLCGSLHSQRLLLTSFCRTTLNWQSLRMSRLACSPN
jgi:hypothetical protein